MKLTTVSSRPKLLRDSVNGKPLQKLTYSLRTAVETDSSAAHSNVAKGEKKTSYTFLFWCHDGSCLSHITNWRTS